MQYLPAGALALLSQRLAWALAWEGGSEGCWRWPAFSTQVISCDVVMGTSYWTQSLCSRPRPQASQRGGGGWGKPGDQSTSPQLLLHLPAQRLILPGNSHPSKNLGTWC